MSNIDNFWLNQFSELINFENMDFSTTVEKLNFIARWSLVFGIIGAILTKNKIVFLIGATIMIITILFHNLVGPCAQHESFVADRFDSGARLARTIKDPKTGNTLFALTPGTNRIWLSNLGFLRPHMAVTFEEWTPSPLHLGPAKLTNAFTSVIENTVQFGEVNTGGGYGDEDGAIPATLLDIIPENMYFDPEKTKILSDLVVIKDLSTYGNPRISIEKAEGGPMSEHDFFSWSSGGVNFNKKTDPQAPGQNPHENQGVLPCRGSTLNNPMGNTSIAEYDVAPTTFSSCNYAIPEVKKAMDQNVVSTVCQRPNDQLFGLGNSQFQFAPLWGTNPSQQTEFANWTSNIPTNYINPRYVAAFANQPDVYKKLAPMAGVFGTGATGSENGGGGGGN